MPQITNTDVDAFLVGTPDATNKSNIRTRIGAADAATNTGDETATTIKSKLGVTTLSGSNTGDQVLPTLTSLNAQVKLDNTNLRTINGTSLLGSGDISIGGGSAGTTYSAGNGLALTGTTFSVNNSTAVAALSGTNTGDQTLPTLSSLGAAPSASPTLTGHVQLSGQSSQTLTDNSAMTRGLSDARYPSRDSNGTIDLAVESLLGNTDSPGLYSVFAIENTQTTGGSPNVQPLNIVSLGDSFAISTHFQNTIKSKYPISGYGMGALWTVISGGVSKVSDFTISPTAYIPLASGVSVTFGITTDGSSAGHVLANEIDVYIVAEPGAGTVLIETQQFGSTTWVTEASGSVSNDNINWTSNTTGMVSANDTTRKALIWTTLRTPVVNTPFKGEHQYILRVTCSGGPVKVLGARMRKTMATERCSVFSIIDAPGNPMTSQLTYDANVMTPVIKRLSPNLFLWKEDDVDETGLTSLITQFNAMVGATIPPAWILCGNHQNGNTNATQARTFAKTVAKVAKAKEVSFFDVDSYFERNYTKSIANGFYNPDKYHLNDLGRIAEAVGIAKQIGNFSLEFPIIYGGGDAWTYARGVRSSTPISSASWTISGSDVNTHSLLFQATETTTPSASVNTGKFGWSWVGTSTALEAKAAFIPNGVMEWTRGQVTRYTDMGGRTVLGNNTIKAPSARLELDQAYIDGIVSNIFRINGPTGMSPMDVLIAGASIFKIGSSGGLNLSTTTSTSGLAVTHNGMTGSVIFPAATLATTPVVVTNTLVTSNSIVIATIQSNDTTARSVRCVASTGSISLYLDTAPTSNCKVSYLLIN